MITCALEVFGKKSFLLLLLYRFYCKMKNESGIILPRVRHGSAILEF